MTDAEWVAAAFSSETEKADQWLVKQQEELIEEWRTYRDAYLTAVSKEEALTLAALARAEVTEQIGELPYSQETIREASRAFSTNDDPEAAEIMRQYFSHSEQLMKGVIDRLWEAGYLITYDRETYNYQPYLTGEGLVWRVKRNAPSVPPSPFSVGETENPSAGLVAGRRPFKARAHAYPDHLRPTLSAPPYTFIDRATRDGRNWEYNPALEIFPFYRGNGVGMTLTYVPVAEEGNDLQTVAALAVEEVSKLDDRTADVWRVILWKAMENGPAPENVYGRIRVDAREFAQLMGYKKAVKGGMKPEHLLEVQQGLQHLERLRLYMDPATRGTLERDAGQASSKRPRRSLQRAREERIMTVMAREVERDLFGKTYHMVWEIALGDWARHFPRSYAPMVRALVELSAKEKWAKRIGTELMLLYREDAKNGKRVKSLRWSTILERAGLLREVDEMRRRKHTSRAKGFAEKAMDRLAEIGVLEQWQVREADLALCNDTEGKPGHFDQWLKSVVEIHAPADVVQVLDSIRQTKPKQATQRKKASK